MPRTRNAGEARLLDWTLINHGALKSIDFDGLLHGVERFDCNTFRDEVSRVERQEGRWSVEQRECLRFVDAVLAMMLRADQPAEPFGPLFVMGGQRSAIPTDFPKQELLGLQAWALSLQDPELRARFLDVLWIQARSFLRRKAPWMLTSLLPCGLSIPRIGPHAISA